MNFTVYTDGSCIGNPGPGGWAWYCVELDKAGYGEVAGPTTNNETEMMAVLEALGAMPDGSHVSIVTDSKMVIGWLAKGWKIKSNPRIADLKAAIRTLRDAKGMTVGIKKVKGHANDPYNSRVDALAREAARRRSRGILPIPKVPSFATVRIGLEVRDMGIASVKAIIDACERLGASANGLATEYNAEGEPVALARIDDGKIEIGHEITEVFE